MRKLILLFLCGAGFSGAFGQRDYAKLVNPFIGTGGHGHTFPGASMPFGMMQLSPDTRLEGWDGCGGYHYTDSVIYGFSHTHLSGTGIPDYCDVLLMPFTGEVHWNNTDYRSPFSHQREQASPGYYAVHLDKNNIDVALTTSYRSGMHQYSFPADAKTGSVLIDLKHRDEVLDAYFEKVNDHEIKGYRRSKSWAQDQTVFFYIKFEQAISEIKINDGNKVSSDIGQLKGKSIQASLNFILPADHKIHCKIGISGISIEGAKLNLDTEIPDWNFEKVHQNAVAAWNKELSKIDVKGGKPEDQAIFYTALYHTFLVPNIYQDVDGQFRSTDLKVHKAYNFTNYTVFSLWDTYRAYNPLMTIINRKRTNDWIQTFLAQYQYGGMLPVWELSGNETFCMIGYHSVPVIVDAYKKGINGFDKNLALQAMQSYAESNRFGLPYYMQNGYLSNEVEHESASKTLEYAFDDWCIAQFAKWNGSQQTYLKFIQRAHNYQNLFDPQTHNMRGKLQGIWYTPFDPKEINNFYTEGNSWQYSFAAPHDIENLIRLHGGREAFAAKLDELFSTSSKTTGRDQSDVTGLIGQYAQGNEPSHHMAYLFNFAGMPWRTQELIHKICREFYKNDPDGLIGNEDCGQMSAWYILSAMGIYEVCPGTGDYELGTPLFDEVRLHLENGKQFVISAKGRSEDAKYVAGTLLNGKPNSKSFISYNDIWKGGHLEFTMSNQPDHQWATKKEDCPKTEIDDSVFVAVPYFDLPNNKFKEPLKVAIKALDHAADIYYGISKTKQIPVFRKYSEPFVIDSNCTVFTYAVKGKTQSKTVVQDFYRMPNDREITIQSKVNPMYTGGGVDLLIDGMEGSPNWRSGGWQGYYDQDFEAIIDLKKVRDVRFAGVHVLQDVSPWILYPKEVIFYTSIDGKNFKEAARVANKADQQMSPAEVQELGSVVNWKTRYVKVKAVNGGKLPAWHESAGMPSHLFIDEVIIR